MSAALALVGFSSSPVLAGHYEKSAPIYSGSSLPANDDSPLDENDIPITSWAEGAPLNALDNYNPNKAASASSSGPIKYVFKWVPDDASDTPPDKVWVTESASATWEAHIDGAQWHSMTGQPCPIDTSFSGSASDGLDGTYVPDSPTGAHGVMGGHCTSSKVTKVAGGASFSCICSPSATATASGGQYWRGGVTVSVGYTVEIVATPYNFKLKFVPYFNPTDYSYDFTYSWKSTKGNISTLTAVTVYEHVEFPNGIIPPQTSGTYEPSAPTTFYPPNPPFAYTQDNPIDYILYPTQQNALRAAGTAGVMTDTHSVPRFAYGEGSYTANQEYRWRSTEIHKNAKDHEVMDGLGAMHTIKRSVVFTNSHYYYSITKHDQYAAGQNLP